MTEWHEIREHRCPTCDSPCNIATNVTGASAGAPQPGHLAICLFCGAVLQFEAGGRLTVVDRPEDLPGMTPADLDMLRQALEASRRWRSQRSH